MSKENFKRTLALAWGASAVALTAHAVNVTDTFEGDALGSTPEPWSGYCYVSNNVGSYAKDPPGCPVQGDHTKMLSVEGSAERSYSESGNRVVELLVMADELPDEELPEASGDEQLKLAFDTTGCINLYHKPSAEAAARWSKLSDTVYPKGTWVRLSFLFDYTHHLCQLKIDGSPCVSSCGFRSASNLTAPGSWYYMATTSASSLAKIDFVGCGGVDDVVNADMASYTPSTGDTTATNGVDYAWFDKNGIAWSDPDATQAPGGSGYTLKQSFDAGTDPFSSDKLYVSDAGYTASQLVLKFNGCGRAYRVEKSSAPFVDNTSATDAGGTFTSNVLENTTTWTGEFPSANLTYYRVRNSSAVTAETVNQFAIMKISSSSANTLVALPWRSLSSDIGSPTPITAANVVMTNNLVNGGWLLYYDGGFKGWCLTDGVWTPTASVDVSGVKNVTAAAENAQLARGQAIWLVRTTEHGRNLNQPFYLYGQYDAASGSTQVPAGGSLLANPDVKSSFVVSSEKISNAAANDEIRVPDTAGGLPRVIKKFDDGWKVKTITNQSVPDGGPYGGGASETTWSASGNLTVPAGQGFMYIRSSSEGTAPTVNW